ncbi:MAG TPA: hypothetical protein VF502_17710, partial [Stellaceae bacterium]
MVSRAPTAAPPPETAEDAEPPTIDPHVAAAAAHLHYVSDLMLGIKYIDHDGRWHRISSEHVNAYLHETAGHTVAAKDYRTWAGTNLAVLE